MSRKVRENAWQRWVRQPQKVWLRRAIFQVHLWSGIGLGLYIFFISLTGSVLVYRNELYVAATPEPVLVPGAGPVLSDGDLTEAVLRAYADSRVSRMIRPRNPDQAVEVWIDSGGRTLRRLVDPRSGAGVGSAAAVGLWLVTKLMELHDDLLGGTSGRRLNGLGAVAVFVVAVTGSVIWWPGIRRWRRSLAVRRGVGWKRFVWDLHSMIGFWSLGFVVVSAISGLYLCVPELFHSLADRLQPPTEANAGSRFFDRVLYWLAYLHFGRINGIGIPCSGPGLCDQATKAFWAILGLAPAAMFATGTIMWWNRVLRPRWRAARRDSQ